MQSFEYELTYLAAKLPREISSWPQKKLVDIYIPADLNVHPRIRLRQKGENFELTKKVPVDGADSSVHQETTIPLSRQEFEALAAVSSRAVEKTRYYGRVGARDAEIDVFEGVLKGLVLIDFEFETKEALEAFSPPEECLADVTQETFIAGGVLAGRCYSDIQEELARFGYVSL